jgi:hypothetical protein
MLLFILAEDLLTALGRIAAIILVLYVFVFAVAGLLASALLLYGNTWARERVGLLKNLRLIVQNIDTAVHSTSSETLPATLESDNRLEQTAHAIKMLQSVQVVQKTKDVQREVNTIEQKVEQGTDRVAEAVIEFRARTVMVQSMLKAFFLPGLTQQKLRAPLLLKETLDSGDGSISPGESMNVVVAQPNLPDGQDQPTGAGQLKPLASRVDDAPGR